jgi:putative hydrolase of the HAD superfamily
VCTGEWGEEFYKPHPRAFEFIQKKFGDGDRTFAYVADNPAKDFHAPIALGWNTVRVRRFGALHFAKEALENFTPKLEIPNLWNLPELIEDFSPLASAGSRSYQ